MGSTDDSARDDPVSHPLRFLVFTPTYSTDVAGRWLSQELADEFCARGHSVDLLCVDASGKTESGLLPSYHPHLRAFQVPGWERSLFSRTGALKYLPQAARLRFDLRTRRFLAGRYDACIFATPGVTAGGLPGQLRKRGRVRKTAMIMWDFFPIANVEIGALPGGWISRLLFLLERKIVRTQDALVLMSPRGEEFLERYYGRVSRRRTIIPPWGADHVRDAHPLPKRERFAVVWGGQITYGRALEDLIHVAADARVVRARVDFLIAGDGPARAGYESLARDLGAANVHFLGRLPRDEYARLLGSCHLAASIMSEMSVPSFPSKVVDYCRHGLPVLAAVESGTDFGEILESVGAGVAVPSGDRPAMTAALLELARPESSQRVESMGAASRQFFEDELDVRVAATRFERLLGAD